MSRRASVWFLAGVVVLVTAASSRGLAQILSPDPELAAWFEALPAIVVAPDDRQVPLVRQFLAKHPSSVAAHLHLVNYFASRERQSDLETALAAGRRSISDTQSEAWAVGLAGFGGIAAPGAVGTAVMREAVRAFDAALARAPTNYLLAGQRAAATVVLSKVDTTRPAESRTAADAALAAWRAMPYPAAAVRNSNQGSTAWRDTYEFLGGRFRAAGELTTALDIYDRLLADAPAKTSAQHEKLRTLAALGRTADIAPTVKAFLGALPKGVSEHFMLAKSLVDIGRDASNTDLTRVLLTQALPVIDGAIGLRPGVDDLRDLRDLKADAFEDLAGVEVDAKKAVAFRAEAAKLRSAK